MDWLSALASDEKLDFDAIFAPMDWKVLYRLYQYYTVGQGSHLTYDFLRHEAAKLDEMNAVVDKFQKSIWRGLLASCFDVVLDDEIQCKNYLAKINEVCSLLSLENSHAELLHNVILPAFENGVFVQDLVQNKAKHLPEYWRVVNLNEDVICKPLGKAVWKGR